MITGADLDRRVRIERPVADDSLDGAGSGEWVLVVEVWAQVQDALPSRGETPPTGTATMMTRPARVRIRNRADVAGNMRFVLGARKMHITAGPAELNGREFIEFMTAEYIPSGNQA